MPITFSLAIGEHFPPDFGQIPASGPRFARPAGFVLWYFAAMSRWLASLLMLVACEGSGASGNAPGDGGARDAPKGTSSDGVSIAAGNVHQVSSVDGVQPASGHILVVIDITLTDAGTKAAPLTPQLFSLETSAGVAFTASPLTSEE